MKGDDEIEKEMVQAEVRWYRQRQWFRWEKDGRVWIVHDMIFPVPPGVSSRPIENSDPVWAYPQIYVNDWKMRNASLSLMPYGEMPLDYLPAVAVVQEGEKKKPQKSFQRWFTGWMPDEFAIATARAEATKQGYDPDEVMPFLNALEKKGEVYQVKEGIYRKV